MRAEIRWDGQVRFCATTESGHTMVLDGAPDAGGENAGMRPMEAVLVGMGACSAFDVVTILTKGRTGLVQCEVVLDAERAESIPKVFTRVHMHYRVRGAALTREKVHRAVELSATKYCSATRMIEKTANVSFDFEIVSAIDSGA